MNDSQTPPLPAAHNGIEGDLASEGDRPAAPAYRPETPENVLSDALDAAIDDALVLPCHGCPGCGERHQDRLIINDDAVTCVSCGKVYSLG